MSVITTTGFGGTGSSAITDILFGHSDVHCLGDDEVWFLHEFWGISDLEHYICECPNRSKISHAILQFEANVERNLKLYNKLFNNCYYEESIRFIDQITCSKFNKSIAEYEVDNKIKKFIIYNLQVKVLKLLNILLNKPHDELKVRFPARTHKYSNDTIESYRCKVLEYTDRLFFKIKSTTTKNHIVCDQLVPAMGYSKYFNYVNDLKVIVVDRDPRDLYLNNIYNWKMAPYIVNTTDPYEFISWFRSIRSHMNEPTENVLNVKFEDLITNTEHALNRILSHCKLERDRFSINNSKFDAKRSEKNIFMWKRCNDPEIKIIERELKDYCYVQV